MIRSYETAAGPYFLLMFDNIKHFAKLQGNFADFCGRVTSNPFIHLCIFVISFYLTNLEAVAQGRFVDVAKEESFFSSHAEGHCDR